MEEKEEAKVENNLNEVANENIMKKPKVITRKVPFIIGCVFLAITLILAIIITRFTIDTLSTQGSTEALALIILLPMLFIYYGAYLVFAIPALVLSIKSLSTEVKGIKIASIITTVLSGLCLGLLVALIVLLFVLL